MWAHASCAAPQDQLQHAQQALRLRWENQDAHLRLLLQLPESVRRVVASYFFPLMDASHLRTSVRVARQRGETPTQGQRERGYRSIGVH